jgi:hypothetical protein
MAPEDVALIRAVILNVIARGKGCRGRRINETGGLMKRTGVAVLATLVAGAVVAVPAQAACKTSCLNRKVSTLQRQVVTMEAQIGSLLGHIGSLNGALQAEHNALGALTSCLRETPISQYGDPAGSFGYVFDNGTGPFYTTGLDVTGTGDSVGAWFLSDACNGTATGSAAYSGRF